MKTQIGVGVAVLSALAAEGKDFDRDELNAMLDKLAASPVPKVRRGPTATCYSIAIPRPEVFEHVCKKCGNHTVYPKNRERMERKLARYREEAASLRALGLNIMLDESALCAKCCSLKDLDIPTRGKIVKAPTPISRWGKPISYFSNGERLLIKKYDYDSVHSLVVRLDLEFFVNKASISSKGGDGEVVVEGSIYYGPSISGPSPSIRGLKESYVKRGTVLKRLPTERDDEEKKLVRVEFPPKEMDDGCRDIREELMPTDWIGDFSYDETDEVSLARFRHLAWIINGKRTVVQEIDAKILEKFIKGDVYLYDGSDGTSVSMKSCLPRLRELLGPVSESDGLAPKEDPGDVPVEVDI